MFLSHYMGLYAAALSSNSSFGVQNINQSRLGLANSASPHFGQTEVSSLHAQDKALTLQGLNAQMNYQVAQALMSSAQKLKEQEKKQRENALASGSIFF